MPFLLPEAGSTGVLCHQLSPARWAQRGPWLIKQFTSEMHSCSNVSKTLRALPVVRLRTEAYVEFSSLNCSRDCERICPIVFAARPQWPAIDLVLRHQNFWTKTVLCACQ